MNQLPEGGQKNLRGKGGETSIETGAKALTDKATARNTPTALITGKKGKRVSVSRWGRRKIPRRHLRVSIGEGEFREGKPGQES